MRARTRTSLALLATVALAGCGSGPTVRERSGAFTVTLDEYLIRPQQIHVPKDTALTVTVVNHGRLGHTFRLRSASQRLVLKLTTIAPGASKQRTFHLRPGHYTMFCALANHEELGMHGTLVVG